VFRGVYRAVRCTFFLSVDLSSVDTAHNRPQTEVIFFQIRPLPRFTVSRETSARTYLSGVKSTPSPRTGWQPRYGPGMIALIYQCPTTGRSVQTWVADEPPADGRDSVKCLACRMMHLVDRATGKVMATTKRTGADDKSKN